MQNIISDNAITALISILSFIVSKGKGKLRLIKKSTSYNPIHLSLFPQENRIAIHLSQILQLSEIAQTVNVSVSHYSFLFRKKTGFAPVEYFIQLKIQKACQYLLFTDLHI